MAQPAKYLFDNEFEPANDGSGGYVSGVQRYSRGDIEAIRAEGFAEGFAAGRAEAEQDRERIISGALATIAETVPHLTGELVRESERLRDEARTLALTIARKIVPALMANNPYGDLDALLTEALAQLSSEPFIAVRVHESLVDEIRTRTDRIAAQNGFEGKLVLIGEPDVAPADCRIEWADGGIVRNVADTCAQIEEIVTRHIGAVKPVEACAGEAPKTPDEPGDGQ